MSAVPNHALSRLRAGKLAIGLGVRQARTVDIAQIAKTAGFDWLFIDGEHSSIDADEAQRVAAACRFPPLGKRSMGGGLQQLGFAPMPLGEAARIVNEETLVVVMIESPRGVANCEEIAAVAGIDALLIGTNDLCFELGIPGQFDDPRVAEAYRKVIAACRRHGKFPGMGGMYTPELLERHVGMGVQLVLAGSDFSLLMQAGTARAALVRSFDRATR